VGIGTFLFHGTLNFHAQMIDEVPLIFLVAAIVYCLKEGQTEADGGGNTRLALVLAAYCIMGMVAYIVLDLPAIYQVRGICSHTIFRHLSSKINVRKKG